MAENKQYRGSRVEMEEAERTYSGFMLAFKVGSLLLVAAIFGLVAIFVWHFNPLAVIIVALAAVAALGNLAGVRTFPLIITLVVTAGVLIVGALIRLFM